jgi:hypothetical protein
MDGGKTMNYKYPYIKGGKQMVAAVLGACKMISDTGYFNKAVSYYSEKYDVDKEELAKNIRARQAAGQKGRTCKYRYYAVLFFKDYYTADDAGTRASWIWEEQDAKKHTYVKVLRATNKKNAETQIDNMGDACFPYKSGTDYWVFHIKEFTEKKEAEKYLECINWEKAKSLMPKHIKETWAITADENGLKNLI